jgi:tetratricopeptide (TPR) repeat protein
MGWIVAGVLFCVMVFAYWNSTARKVAAVSVLAERAFNSKDWPSAERLLRETHARAGQWKEPGRSRIQGDAALRWGVAVYRQGKMREAEDLFRQAASKLGVSFPAGHPVTAQAYLMWGDLCVDEERYPEAEGHYRKALETDERTGNLAMMIFDLQRLGDALIRQSRRAEAEEVIERAIALETRVVHEQLRRSGKDPGTCNVVSMSMPDLYFCRQQYEDARRLYREKVQYWEKSVSKPDNVDVGHLQMRLALAEAGVGDAAAALDMYRQAAATFKREWSDNHPKTLAALAGAATLQAEQHANAGELR